MKTPKNKVANTKNKDILNPRIGIDMKIYTKTGDKGSTRLVDGRECSKANIRVETYGTVDELNSNLGLVLAFCELQSIKPFLLKIQNQLFNIGSHLACEKDETKQHLPQLHEEWIKHIEDNIDAMTSELPELRQFILPGGSHLAAFLHQARTVCRRSERMVVRLIEEELSQKKHTTTEIEFSLRYLNRLSDWLFVAARWSNHKLNIKDTVWEK